MDLPVRGPRDVEGPLHLAVFAFIRALPRACTNREAVAGIAEGRSLPWAEMERKDRTPRAVSLSGEPPHRVLRPWDPRCVEPRAVMGLSWTRTMAIIRPTDGEH